MKKFIFKLEAVLRERKRVEDQRLRDWTMSRIIVQGMRDQLTALEARLAATFKETTEAHTRGSSHVGLLQSIEAFIAGTKTRIEWKRREIERAEKILEKARLLYVTARQKREAIDKLKERRWDDFKNAIRVRELKNLDDLYIMNGAARRQMDNEDGEAEI